MATLRWRTETETPTEVVVFTSELIAPNWRTFASLMRTVWSITRQLRSADGAVGYELVAQPLRRRMTTTSAWRDRNALHGFVGSEPHRGVMVRLGGRVGTPVFATTTVAGTDLVRDAEHHLRSTSV